MVRKDNTDSAILLESSLQSFFFQKLQEINEKYSRPLPKETIFYSSLVMDKFGESKRYFEIQEGKVREKILGQKLLESGHLSRTHQKAVLKDIGDTALLICGYFSESLNRKLVDTRYYQELGRTAYDRLNGISPEAFEVRDLYAQISRHFQELTDLMGFYSKTNDHFDPDEAFIIVNHRQVKAS